MRSLGAVAMLHKLQDANRGKVTSYKQMLEILTSHTMFALHKGHPSFSMSFQTVSTKPSMTSWGRETERDVRDNIARVESAVDIYLRANPDMRRFINLVERRTLETNEVFSSYDVENRYLYLSSGYGTQHHDDD